jgi:hypothetical protein
LRGSRRPGRNHRHATLGAVSSVFSWRRAQFLRARDAKTSVCAI